MILQIDAYLPDTYISDQRHKIEIYKKIRQIDNRVNYEELQEELMDRFGEYPDVVAYLLEIGLVKSYLDKVFVCLLYTSSMTFLNTCDLGKWKSSKRLTVALISY